MMLTTGMMTSNHDDWETPQEFFDNLNDEFHFTLDVCATHTTHKCPAYFTPEFDGLSKKWTGICWMNPPYGREISKWIQKAYKSAQEGASVVCLIPARTDTDWWQDYVLKATEIRFIRGRLYFKRGEISGRAPFPSAVVIFRGDH